MPLTSKSFAILCLIAAACAPAAVHPPQAGQGAAEVRNVVFMVTDGGGVAYWSAAEIASDRLAVRRMPVVGLVDTQSSSHRVTDSAAGATVYASATRTYNGAIAVGPACLPRLLADSVAVRANPTACDPLESVFDIARRKGMLTGVVTTTAVTDATPAAFVAVSPRRYWQPEIARQYAEADIEVILGGGRMVFDSTRTPDGRSLLQSMCARAACVANARELAAWRSDDRPLVGLFADESVPPAGARSPSLPDMARAALTRLSRGPRGFMAVIETEGTDEAGHANEPLASIVREMQEFDRAVGVVLDFAERNPGTLVIVTADHETGGLTLPASGDSLVAHYTTGGHTAAMVPLFAFGPGAERFGGLRDNVEIGRTLREVVSAIR